MDEANKQTKSDFIRDLIENKFAAIKDNFKECGLLQDDKKNGLVKIHKIIKVNGPNTLIVEAYSSGAESDMEDEKLDEATVKDVYNTLWDYNTIMVIVKLFLTF
jgi:hypothetical protein